MNPRRKSPKVIAALAAFALVHVSFQLGLAESPSNSSSTLVQQALGRLSTKGTAPVQVNGNNAVSGDTIATGAVIQTLGGSEAVVDLGPLGTVELAPGSRVKLDFSCVASNPADPSTCQLTVTLFSGCIVTKYREGSSHLILNADGTRRAESDDEKERRGGGVIRNCSDGAAVVPPPVAGLGKRGLLAILGAVGGTAAIIALVATSGDNPSLSTP